LVGFELAQARLTIEQARIRTATAKESAVNDALTLPELTCTPARNPTERRKSQLCKAFRVGRTTDFKTTLSNVSLALVTLAGCLRIREAPIHIMDGLTPHEALSWSSRPDDLVGSALDGCSLPVDAMLW